jgi:hypothetical protein
LSSLEGSYAGPIKINIMSLGVVRNAISCSGWLTREVGRVRRLPNELARVLARSISMWLYNLTRPIARLLAITTVRVLRIGTLSSQCRGCIVTFDHGWGAGVKRWLRLGRIVQKDGRVALESCRVPFIFIVLAFAPLELKLK